jgi:hypothetical protein
MAINNENRDDKMNEKDKDKMNEKDKDKITIINYINKNL